MSGLLLQAIASGIVVGSVYALIALALVILYKSTDVVNFAGGEYVMVGGYIALFQGTPPRALSFSSPLPPTDSS